MSNEASGRVTDGADRAPAAYRYDEELPESSKMLEELLKTSEIQQLFESYYNLIRIPVAIIDLHANVLASSRWQRICTEFHRVHPDTCARCIECDTVLAQRLSESRTHASYPCLNGLTDCASPIIIEGRHVANLFIGQFLTEPPDEARFRRQAEDFGFDPEAYIAALREVPVVDEKGISHILDLLARMTRVVTNLSIDRKRALEEGARQTIILDTIPQGVFWKGLDGRYLGCNAAFATVAGLARPDDIVGKTDFDLPWSRSEAEAYRADDQAVIATNRPRLHIVEPIQGADGSRIVADTSKIPLTGVGGASFGVVGIYDDVTERAHAEVALRQSEEMYRTLFEATPLGIVLIGPDGVVVQANTAEARMFGYDSPAEVIGMHATLLVAPSSRPVSAQILARRLAGEEVPPITYELVRKDGTTFPGEVSASILRGRDGEVSGYICVTRDLTEVKQAESALSASEVRYRTMFEHAAFGILQSTSGGRALAANPAFVQMLGYASEREVLETLTDLPRGLWARPEEREIVRALIVEQGYVRGYECRFLRKDGETIWISLNATIIQEPDGSASFVGFIEDITQRRLAEQELAASNRELQVASERLVLATRAASLGVWDWDVGDDRLVWDDGMYRLYGLRREDFDGAYAAWSGAIHPEDKALAEQAIQDALHGVREYAPEFRIILPDGSIRHIQAYALTFRAPDGRPLRMVGTNVDITEEKRAQCEREALEEQLRVSQKLEAIGSLAGGVAHDFNNLLSVIQCYTGFAIKAMQPGDPRRSDLEEVRQAATRAEALTRQLLAFSRKQVLQPVLLDLNQVISGVEKMLRRLISEDVELVISLAPDLGPTLADPGQMEQVLMNLAVNARDAMPTGGRLTIETAHVEIDDRRAAHQPELAPGPYARLVVADTGLGMDAATRARIFEPFFTTKEKGKGTGLGLPTVYGIVKQSGGYIEVESEPGRGTAFTILLPCRPDGELAPAPDPSESPALAESVETILVVDDEEPLRKAAARSLRAAGFTVLTAGGGEEALRISAEHPGEIQLLLSDVVMPNMSGKELAERLAASRPTTKVLFMSGYTDDVINPYGILDPGIRLLNKPFAPAALVRAVQDALQGG